MKYTGGTIAVIAFVEADVRHVYTPVDIGWPINCIIGTIFLTRLTDVLHADEFRELTSLLETTEVPANFIMPITASEQTRARVEEL
jgi:hypothetical protein